MKLKYRYIGAGAFFEGIPARDLTEADWAALSKEQQTAVANSAIYVAVSTTKKAGE